MIETSASFPCAKAAAYSLLGHRRGRHGHRCRVGFVQNQADVLRGRRALHRLRTRPRRAVPRHHRGAVSRSRRRRPRGALLHDIGKMGVPDAILLDPGPLTEEEWAVMRQHPIHAYNLLLPIVYLRPALDIPYRHH